MLSENYGGTTAAYDHLHAQSIKQGSNIEGNAELEEAETDSFEEKSIKGNKEEELEETTKVESIKQGS